MSGYARVGYQCRCSQVTMERRLSSREAERQCLYQRAMVTLFHDMIHHGIECYVDDMIAKSQTEEGHLADRGKKRSRGALSDYVAPQPIEDYQPRKFEFPDEDISRCSNRKIVRNRSRRRGLDPKSERVLMSDGEVKVNKLLLPG
ncbi:hypothetical protein KIW84_013350 [Lathyrus oleraceus]|uniref:Uncharacterized protein n=1 Tax=Pisum sativum TaxID=3888 RepID=A0A9D5BJT8_PEA|nr:hypothetical protein KIW84_013350 [Pisum sativum]